MANDTYQIKSKAQTIKKKELFLIFDFDIDLSF